MRVLKTSEISSCHTIRFVEHSGRKFKITYNNENGMPMGFDSRFKCEVLADDSWKVIAGKNDINFNEVMYVARDEKMIKDKNEFIMQMQSHIEMLYDAPV